MSSRDLPPHGELLRRQAEAHGQRLFAVVDDETISYRQLYERARAIARGLGARGVRRGDRIGVLMPNCIEFFVTHFAIQLLGAITVTINARYKSFELAHAIRKSDIRLLFTTDRIDEHVNFCDLLHEALPEVAAAVSGTRLQIAHAPRLEGLVLCGKTRRSPFMSLDSLTAQGKQVSSDEHLRSMAAVAVDDVAVMLFTSGTTAAPKACQLTHRGLYQTWAYTYPDAVKLQAGEKVWVPMPCFHVGGVGLSVSALCRGATFVTSIHHEGAAALRLLVDHGVEHLYPGFYTLMLPVMRAQGYDRALLGAVRSISLRGPVRDTPDDEGAVA